jgi:trigger factor
VQHARVPGFRKGKVPRKIFEAQYGTSGITERAFEEVVPAAYSRAIEEHALDPVDRPDVELLPQEDGQPMRLKAVVAVRPEIALGNYKGIELTARSEQADDADVERTIERLRNDAATLVPVERPVALGDFATLDYEGTIDGVPFEGGTAKESLTEIAEGRFIPGFAEGIVGMKAGESKEIAAAFPADYGQEALAGKNAVFAVTVHDVKEREVPALDDELAKRFDSENVEALRQNIRARLDAQAARQARELRVSELIDKLIAMHDFPVPAVMVEREVESMLDEGRQNAARFGVSWEEYLAAGSTSEDDLRAQYAAESERRVKGTLIVEAIGKAEKIEALPPDIDAEFTELSRRYGQPKDQIKKLLRGKMDSVIDGIVRSKTLDVLLEESKVAPPEAAATIVRPA